MECEERMLKFMEYVNSKVEAGQLTQHDSLEITCAMSEAVTRIAALHGFKEKPMPENGAVRTIVIDHAIDAAKKKLRELHPELAQEIKFKNDGGMGYN